MSHFFELIAYNCLMKTNHLIILTVVALVLLCSGVAVWLFNYKQSELLPTPPPVATLSPSGSPTSLEARLDDLIVVTSPVQGAQVTSPITIKGSARGSWYFEGVFPVVLLDSTGKEIARSKAQAQGEWTTADYVPFTATLTFPTPATTAGTLVLEKDNPSGLPENDKNLSISVTF